MDLGVNGEIDSIGEKGVKGNGVEGFEQDDDFGGWDEEEDSVYLERARRRWARKMGIDLRAIDRGKES